MDAVAGELKGARRGMPFRWSSAKALAVVYLLAVYVYLFLPSVLVGLMSFHPQRVTSFPLKGLTVRWWKELFADEVVWAAARSTLTIAVVTTLVTTLLAILTAYALVRFRFRLKAVFIGILIGVMLIPYLVVGIALLSFWAILGVERGVLVVVLAHVALALPYAALVIAARLQGFDVRLEEAAEILGAGRLTVFRRVTLPLLMPGIVAAAALTFTISVDEFNVAYFLIGTDTTLPIYIFSSLRFGVTPELNAISTLILVVSMGFSVFALRRV
jgi:spermidine/putrescine transport system permease protein